MIVKRAKLADLYEADETAWLDAMADLIRRGAYSELDYEHLQEYLNDMSTRERHEVKHRLIRLIAHVLKWEHQASRRSRSWRHTIFEQQRRLRDDISRGALRNHALEILPEVYQEAINDAMDETGVAKDALPVECPYTLDELLMFDMENGL